MATSLIIIGAGGHAVSVHNVAVSAGFLVQGFIDYRKKDETLLQKPIYRNIDEIGDVDTYRYAIAIGSNYTRERVLSDIYKNISMDRFPPLIHESCIISCGSTVGNGSVIMPNCTIGPSTEIGNFCIINTNSSIDHNSRMGDFSSLAPGCTTGGNVHIGIRSAVSIGATIKHGIIIGDDTVIGASSYVNRSFGDSIVAYGTPAEFVRERKCDESYLL